MNTVRKNHRLTKYIKVLGKQNAWNTFAVCLACAENLEEGELSKLTFTNKKPQVKNYLKNCTYFREQEEVDAIINLTMKNLQGKNVQELI